MTIMKLIYIGVGFLFFGIGTIGIFLPLLPTAPFYLLSTVSFAKGSTRFCIWSTNTKLYKKHLGSFAENRSMPLKTKAIILISASISLLLISIAVNLLAVKVAIAVLLLIKHWYFIFIIKTSNSNKPT